MSGRAVLFDCTGGSVSGRSSIDGHLSSIRGGLTPHGFVLVFLIGLAVMVLRRVDAVTDPKLWAEDGLIYLPDAYAHGVIANLGNSYAGGLHTISRLWAQLTTHLPVSATAALYTWFALVFDAGCCATVLSRRLRWLIPSDVHRGGLFVLLVLLPAQDEIHSTLVNTEWFTGVAILVLGLADDPKTRWGRVVERAFFALAVLSGPQGLLLSPLLAVRWVRMRSVATALTIVSAGVAGFIQGIVLLQHTKEATVTNTHPDLGRASAIIVERVGGVMVYGQHYAHAAWSRHGTSHSEYAAAAAMLVCFALVLARLPRLVIATLLGALAVDVGAVAWKFRLDLVAFADPGNGARYFTVPMAVMVIAVVTVAARPGSWRGPVLAVLTAAPLVAIGVATWSDAELSPLPTTNWPASAECIASHRACSVPINPPGWKVDLPPLPSAH